MHSPTTRLNKYLLDFRLTIPRCRHCINKLSPVIESFNKGISIRSVNNALWDEFKCGNITDLGDLVRFTMKTFEHLNALSWTLAIRPPILLATTGSLRTSQTGLDPTPITELLLQDHFHHSQIPNLKISKLDPPQQWYPF
ncbi:hypothetical protein GEMRC1_000772 [Eukaryota sp. GEM-RC1]